MKRNRAPSKKARQLLATMLTQPEIYRYGYELMKVTGISSGTLYPILMRLEERGFLEAQWRSSNKPGRPPRHAYKLTNAGIQFAVSELENSKKPIHPVSRKAHI